MMFYSTLSLMTNKGFCDTFKLNRAEQKYLHITLPQFAATLIS